MQPVQMGARSLGAHPSNRIEVNSKVKSAAQQFESMLLSTLLEKMDESFGSFGEQTEDTGSGTLKGVGMQALGAALSASGGIGIWRMIVPVMSGGQEADVSSAGTDTLFDQRALQSVVTSQK